MFHLLSEMMLDALKLPHTTASPTDFLALLDLLVVMTFCQRAASVGTCSLTYLSSRLVHVCVWTFQTSSVN
jgi:hypothetical protein